MGAETLSGTLPEQLQHTYGEQAANILRWATEKYFLAKEQMERVDPIRLDSPKFVKSEDTEKTIGGLTILLEFLKKFEQRERQANNLILAEPLLAVTPHVPEGEESTTIEGRLAGFSIDRGTLTLKKEDGRRVSIKHLVKRLVPEELEGVQTYYGHQSAADIRVLSVEPDKAWVFRG